MSAIETTDQEVAAVDPPPQPMDDDEPETMDSTSEDHAAVVSPEDEHKRKNAAAETEAETAESPPPEPDATANAAEDDEVEDPVDENDAPVAEASETAEGPESAAVEEAIEEEENEEEPESAPLEDDDGEDAESDEDAEGSNTKKQKATAALPPRPIKRARTAYFIFTDEKRPQVQAEHPGEGVAVVARIMGQMWSQLTAEEKETYQVQAAQERDRVAKELEEWKAAGGVIEEDDMPAEGNKESSSLIYPLGRIRKICKLDPEVRGVSKEALLLITKCAELATAKLGQESVRVAQLQNRRKLLPEDVAHVCSHREQFLFLKEDVKDLVKNTKDKQQQEQMQDAKTTMPVKKSDVVREAAAAGSKPLTSYFATKK